MILSCQMPFTRRLRVAAKFPYRDKITRTIQELRLEEEARNVLWERLLVRNDSI